MTLPVHLSTIVRYEEHPMETDGYVGEGPYRAIAGHAPGHRMEGRGPTVAQALSSLQSRAQEVLGSTGCPGIVLEIHLHVTSIRFPGRDGGGAQESSHEPF